MLARKALAARHQRRCIYIPVSDRLQVRQIAADEGVPENELYRRFIEEGLRRREEMKRRDEECRGK